MRPRAIAATRASEGLEGEESHTATATRFGHATAAMSEPGPVSLRTPPFPAADGSAPRPQRPGATRKQSGN